MLMIPDLYSSPGFKSVYVASLPSDTVRIHAFVSDDGTAVTPAVFVGATLYRLEGIEI